MSFIDSLSSIATNLGISKLAPANTGAIRESFDSLAKHSKSANVYRAANKDARTLSDVDFESKAQSAFDKAREYEDNNKKIKASRKENEALASAMVSKHHQTALGRGEGVARDGAKLEDAAKLKAFRDLNSAKIKEHTAGVGNARKELLGHAKDYYFSGDLGTNAMRWGATAGAYGAASVGVRALTGGSATTNNQGQRDIAGIPFI